MRRKSIIFGIGLLLINFVSAFSHYRSGRFSLDNFFYRINSETLIFGVLFIIFFALIYYSLSKLFKGSNPYEKPNIVTPAVISLGISILMVYGIYVSDLRYIIYDIGYYTYLLNYLIPIIIIIFIIYLVWLFEGKDRRNRRKRHYRY